MKTFDFSDLSTIEINAEMEGFQPYTSPDRLPAANLDPNSGGAGGYSELPAAGVSQPFSQGKWHLSA